jgi:hypothetical protein
LVLRQTFHFKRNDLKVNLAKWIQHLDSEDVRECGSLPEVAYIRKDDYSDDESSFFINSIRTIMSFEYDDTTKLDNHSATSAANESQKRGRHQIDHIFIPTELISQIKHVQFLDYPSTYNIDHRPMQLILDLRDCIPDLSQQTFGFIRII